jgi:methylenetetrahydrofolate dehydrogenase (NADP+)/methenyltetrahydrofolate cyclohydrolase
MAATVIDGAGIAAEIQEELAAEAARLNARGARPTLAVVLAGDDPASHSYVRSKMKTAERLGIRSLDHLLSAAVPQEELLQLVRRLNADPEVHGILVQMPLPAHLDARRVIEAVDPRKDVDGFHPFNVGELAMGGTAMPPCTPAGVMELLRHTGVELAGKEAVVVGRSMLVGKPVSMMLLAQNATVTVCHSKTRDLPAVCRRADVLVVAIGRARMVTGDYVKEGAVVIDVGINRVDGKTVGDVDFASAAARAAAITPVPKGVGPMTITMLMKNTLAAARLAAGAE